MKTTTTMLVMVGMAVAAMCVGGGSGWKHGLDSATCRPQQSNPGPGLPDLPDSFSLRVEANLLKKQRTITLHEYYDYNDNVAAVRMMDSGTERLSFYLYNSNQYLEVISDNMGGHYCYAQNLNGSDNHDLFGMTSFNSTMGRIFSVKGALHYGGPGIIENYLGKDTVRGIPCNKWKSCQYWSDMDATSTVVWYFSDSTQWSSITGLQTPVRCHVTGTRWMNQSHSYTYEHIYEFYDFQADITGTDRHFEVPTNTICLYENTTKPLPTLPPAYSFNMENLDVTSNAISFIREEYDSISKLLRFDYRETAQTNSPFETRYVSQYHDFNTGVAYVIDVMRDNCTTSVIPRDGFDDADVNKNDVRFKDPNEFLDLNHNYVYQGVRNTRGIDCDTWAAKRSDYPDPTSFLNGRTVWTWYFATADWRRKMGFKDNLALPVMLEIFGDTPQRNIHKQLSFYEYSVNEPNFLNWDLSPCFGPSQSRKYAFLVQGRYSDVVKGDLTSFKYHVLGSLLPVLGVSQLRVSRLDVQEAGSNTLVTLVLLDKATLPGDVVRINDEPDLQTAFTSLNTSVYGGTLKIEMSSPGSHNIQKLNVLPAGQMYQLQSSSSPSSRKKRSASTASATSSSGYTAGAMGGMAVGMLFLGALLGFAVMFAIYKARGGTFRGGDFPMKKFDNE